MIETRSFCFLVKKIVVNSRFGRFLQGFQETFPHRTRKMLTRTTKVILHFFLFCYKLCDLFLLIFNDLKIILQILFLIESIFCALSNEILHSLLL